MTYSSFVPANLDDIFGQLQTFLTTAGWTCNKGTSTGIGYFSARKNSGASYDICFAAQWDTATPANVGIYQWFGAVYATGTAAGAQTNDSGNGAVGTLNNTNFGTNRHVALTNTPSQAWFFEDDHYFHVVVETAGGIYAHFGAGQLDKFNDWTGGEYVYGQRFSTSASSQQVSRTATFLLDGHLDNGVSPDTLTNSQLYAATVHVEGLGEQGGTEKWMVCMGSQSSASLGNDRASVNRRHILGGHRNGWFASNFSKFRGTIGRAVVPMYPIVQFYLNRTTNNFMGPLGQMKDVRALNIRNFVEEEQITVGADTWVVFPLYRKAVTGSESSGYSGYAGVAYKKVVT